MFIWPYKSVMLCCFKHAIIDVIINTEKNCHITVHICILFLGMTRKEKNQISFPEPMTSIIACLKQHNITLL
jgi:hypothetical protein